MKKATGKTLTTRFENARWCPCCFGVLSAATCLTDEVRPEPGDYTVCIYCASVLRFDGQMDYQLSSLEAVPTHIRMQFARIVQAVKERKDSHEPWKF